MTVAIGRLCPGWSACVLSEIHSTTLSYAGLCSAPIPRTEEQRNAVLAMIKIINDFIVLGVKSLERKNIYIYYRKQNLAFVGLLGQTPTIYDTLLVHSRFNLFLQLLLPFSVEKLFWGKKTCSPSGFKVFCNKGITGNQPFPPPLHQGPFPRSAIRSKDGIEIPHTNASHQIVNIFLTTFYYNFLL